MFTKKRKGERPDARRPRGRPRGHTARGAEARRKLYEVAVALIAARGYEATTLRDIARKARVSTGLLYRYFPSKRAVVLALYDELSAEYASRAAAMPAGAWAARFGFALEASLAVLAPHRELLAALLPVLVGHPEEGVLAPTTAFSRARVEEAFHQAVEGAADVPPGEDAAALGRLLYVAHLAVILWWLLDRSPGQQATRQLVAQLAGALPMASLMLRLPPARAILHAADALCREALLGVARDGAEVAP